MSNGKRGRPKDPMSERIIDALHEKFPKFTRSQLSQIKNPAYGLQLASEALSFLEGKGIVLPGNAPNKTVKKIPRRKKENRITIRLNDTQKVRLIHAKEKSGCNTVQEYLEKLIMEDAGGEGLDPMLGLPGADQTSLWDDEAE